VLWDGERISRMGIAGNEEMLGICRAQQPRKTRSCASGRLGFIRYAGRLSLVLRPAPVTKASADTSYHIEKGAGVERRNLAPRRRLRRRR
jgi:hypothetical protein